MSRPQERLFALRARRVSNHMAVPIDAKRLSTIITRQQRNLLKEALRRPDKWNDRLSGIRLSSDFSRIVDTRSRTIFAAVKLTQMLWLLKAAVIPDGRLSLSCGRIRSSPGNI